jgi:hypothetical protein
MQCPLACDSIRYRNWHYKKGQFAMTILYNFGASSFKNELSINGGALFSNVRLVEVDMGNAGAFRLEVVGAAGNVLAVAHRPNAHGGNQTFDFTGGEIVFQALNYALRFWNEAPGTRAVLSGSVLS